MRKYALATVSLSLIIGAFSFALPTLVTPANAAPFQTTIATAHSQDNATWYGGAGLGFGSSESTYQTPMAQGFVATDFACRVRTNARTSTTTLKVRKNGADCGPTLTYTSGQTGVHQDTSNTCTFSAQDLLAISITTGAGSEDSITLSGCTFDIAGGGSSLPADAAGWLENDGAGTLSWSTPSSGSSLPADAKGFLFDDGAGALSWINLPQNAMEYIVAATMFACFALFFWLAFKKR